MITLPWIDGPAARTTPPTPHAVMASRLQLQRLRHVPGFLMASIRLRRAVRDADGAIGLGLRARPLARTFWTLSTWTDQQALQAYAQSPLHRGIVERFRPHMAGSTFRFYAADGGMPPRWDDALRLLDAEAPAATSGTADRI